MISSISSISRTVVAMVAARVLDERDDRHRRDEDLRVPDLPGARQELLREGVGLAQRSAAHEHVRRVGERDDGHLAAALSPVPLDQLPGDAKQLVPSPEIEQGPERLGLGPHDRKGEPAPLPELDPRPLDVQAPGRTLGDPHPVAEVSVGPDRLVPQPEVEAEAKRFPQVGQASGHVAELAPREAPELARPDGLGIEPELLGQGQGLLRPRRAIRGTVGDHVVGGGVRVGQGELASGRLALEQLDRLREERPLSVRLAPEPVRPGQPHHRLARAEALPLSAELDDRLLEVTLGLGQPAADEGGLGGLPEQPCPVGMTRGTELERLPVEGLRLPGVELERAVPGHDQEAPDLSLELVRVVIQSGGLRELKSLSVVVREDLGVVGHPVAGQALDPGGGRPVLAHPRRSGDLLVGDVSDEQVPERVLGLTLDRRVPHGTQELLPGDRPQALLHRALVEPAHEGQRARPEDGAHDGGVVEERLPLGRQRVEPGGDHGLDGLGDRDVGAGRDLHGLSPAFDDPAVGEHASEFPGVQRVSAGSLEQRDLGLGGKLRPGEVGGDQPARLVTRERGERDGGGVPLAAAPSGMTLEELRPRRADDQERQTGRPVHEILHELEQRRAGPVHVLEDQDQRSVGRDGLEETSPGGKRLGSLGHASDAGGARADQERQAGPEPVPLGGILDDRPDGRGELVGCLVGTVRFQDSRLALDDLPQCPEGDALPVGKASALSPARPLGLPVDEGAELAHQATLPDPRLAGHRDELDRTLPRGASVHGLQERQLVAAADEGRGRRLRGIGAVSTAGGFGLPHADRLDLLFDRDRIERLVVHEMPGRPIGRLVDHHRSDRGDRLEAGRRVDHVARRDALAFRRPGPTRHDRFTGGHGGPEGQFEPRLGRVQLLDRLDDAKGGPHRPLGVVLVSHGSAEGGHDGVSDELLHGAAPPHELSSDAGVVRPQRGPDVLGIGLIRSRDEPDEVDAQDRHDLPLFLQLGERRAEGRRVTRLRQACSPLSPARAPQSRPRRAKSSAWRGLSTSTRSRYLDPARS